MKKKLIFIVYNGLRFKRFEYELNLKYNKSGQPCFTASLSIYNSPRASDRCFVCGGQCIDALTPDIYGQIDTRMLDIFNMWTLHHLNDMHAGTEAQEACLKGCTSRDYKEQCEYLKERGLYEDNGYKYGHGWLYRSIPENNLVIIDTLLSDERRETVKIKISEELMNQIDELI